MTYEEAIKQLETIARQLEQNELPIDKVADSLRQAQKLVSFCQKQLTSVDEEVKKIIGGETVE